MKNKPERQGQTVTPAVSVAYSLEEEVFFTQSAYESQHWDCGIANFFYGKANHYYNASKRIIKPRKSTIKDKKTSGHTVERLVTKLIFFNHNTSLNEEIQGITACNSI